MICTRGKVITNENFKCMEHLCKGMFNFNHFYHKVAALPKAGNVEIEAVAVIGKQQKKQIMHLIFLQFKLIFRNTEKS